MGVVLIELWIVFLYFLTTDESSDNQSAFLFKNTDIFNNFFIVLLTLSAIEGPLSVKLE